MTWVPLPILRNLDFVEDQERHRQIQLQSMSSAHNKIAQLMAVIYETFAEDGAEVRPPALLKCLNRKFLKSREGRPS